MGDGNVKVQTYASHYEQAWAGVQRQLGPTFSKLIEGKFRDQWNRDHPNDPAPNTPGSPQNAVDKLIANAKETRAENSKTIDDWLAGAQPQLQTAGDAANKGEYGALGDLSGAAGNANSAEDAAIQDLLSKMPGAVKPSAYTGDVTSQAAGATADPDAIKYQNQALAKLSGLTDPTVTAKERFLEMQARVQEEQSRRAAQQAALADLARRGMRSGGAEIAALNGAQQTTSQNRLMQDLGTNAGAVDRAMMATVGLGNLSSKAREESFDESFKTGSAADDISKFNSKQKADYQQWRDKFKADQNNDIWGREKDAATAKVSGATDKYGRSQDVTNAELGLAKDAYGRTQDQINLGQTATGMKVGVSTSGGHDVSDALKAELGYSAEQEALKALKPSGGLFGGTIWPGVL